MSDTIKVTKLDAARRQLETAIGLYFNDQDPVSIHALAVASHEVLSTLCVKNDKDSGTIAGAGKFLRKGKQKTFYDALKKPQNHFKHADRDPDAVIDFNLSLSEYFIFDSCGLYKSLTKDNTPLLALYTMILPHFCGQSVKPQPYSSAC